MDIYLFEAHKKLSPSSLLISSDSMLSSTYADEYYVLNYDYLIKHKEVLTNLLDYLRLESAFNRDKEFKFGLVITKIIDKK